MEHVCEELKVTERRACRVLGQARSTQHYAPTVRDDEERLVSRVTALASQYGRYGYKMVTGMLKNEGWHVNHKRVARIWRQEGLKVPQKQPKRRRLWLNDGSCVRLRALHPNHVWSYDFVSDRTHDGRPLKLLTLVDEFTRESLAIEVRRQLRAEHVVEVLADLFLMRGVPAYLRSDNGPEFTASVVRSWLAELGVQTLFIEPGSPWENGYIESFNSRLRDEVLNREIFYTVKEARVIIGMWRRHYNQVRPHSSLGYKPPAPEAQMPLLTFGIDDTTRVGLTQ